jgi:hypothetical protein
MSKMSGEGRRVGFSFWSGEGGQSLVEELVAVALVSLALVILIAALSTGSMGVRTTNDRVMAENLAQSQMELIKDAAYSSDPTAYPTVVPVPAYAVTVEAEVLDIGLQVVTVTVSLSGSGKDLLQLEGYKADRW